MMKQILENNLLPISIIFSALMFVGGMKVLSDGMSQSALAIALGIKNADTCNVKIPDNVAITLQGSGYGKRIEVELK
ncbi:MAG TPA: hypothetical protein ENJ28_05490 [Gammaproteobacteria bacterium]|nr:hypothetical protein [Gammaproteobacteria bacterium]